MINEPLAPSSAAGHGNWVPQFPCRSRIQRLRAKAFERQQGRCYYCGWPMWLADCGGFASAYALTMPQAGWLQATAEHLVPRGEGGRTTCANIVAACLYCNNRRHDRRRLLLPETFKSLVLKRLAKGRWHMFHLPAATPSSRKEMDLGPNGIEKDNIVKDY